MMCYAQAVIAHIKDDRSWQENLTNEERERLIAWATKYFEIAMRAAHIRVMGSLRTCNYMVEGKDATGRKKLLDMITGAKDGDTVPV